MKQDEVETPTPRMKKAGILSLLRLREVAPRSPLPLDTRGFPAVANASVGIANWTEDDFLQHCCATYCSFDPPPRSTIAICFSADGTWLASTHGDHTVKLTCCQTGKLVKVLKGHARTPWVVRFHPRTRDILASGDLDHEVKIWSTDAGACLNTYTFTRPVSSMAFILDGSCLAVATGRYLFVWEYLSPLAVPVNVLKTKRSIRCVQYAPHGAPFLVTAEGDTERPLTEIRMSTPAPGLGPSGSPPGPGQAMRVPVRQEHMRWSHNQSPSDRYRPPLGHRPVETHAPPAPHRNGPPLPPPPSRVVLGFSVGERERQRERHRAGPSAGNGARPPVGETAPGAHESPSTHAEPAAGPHVWPPLSAAGGRGQPGNPLSDVGVRSPLEHQRAVPMPPSNWNWDWQSPRDDSDSPSALLGYVGGPPRAGIHPAAAPQDRNLPEGSGGFVGGPPRAGTHPAAGLLDRSLHDGSGGFVGGPPRPGRHPAAGPQDRNPPQGSGGFVGGPSRAGMHPATGPQDRNPPQGSGARGYRDAGRTPGPVSTPPGGRQFRAPGGAPQAPDPPHVSAETPHASNAMDDGRGPPQGARPPLNLRGGQGDEGWTWAGGHAAGIHLDTGGYALPPPAANAPQSQTTVPPAHPPADCPMPSRVDGLRLPEGGHALNAMFADRPQEDAGQVPAAPALAGVIDRAMEDMVHSLALQTPVGGRQGRLPRRQYATDAGNASAQGRLRSGNAVDTLHAQADSQGSEPHAPDPRGGGAAPVLGESGDAGDGPVRFSTLPPPSLPSAAVPPPSLPPSALPPASLPPAHGFSNAGFSHGQFSHGGFSVGGLPAPRPGRPSSPSSWVADAAAALRLGGPVPPRPAYSMGNMPRRAEGPLTGGQALASVPWGTTPGGGRAPIRAPLTTGILENLLDLLENTRPPLAPRPHYHPPPAPAGAGFARPPPPDVVAEARARQATQAHVAARIISDTLPAVPLPAWGWMPTHPPPVEGARVRADASRGSDSPFGHAPPGRPLDLNTLEAVMAMQGAAAAPRPARPPAQQSDLDDALRIWNQRFRQLNLFAGGPPPASWGLDSAAEAGAATGPNFPGDDSSGEALPDLGLVPVGGERNSAGNPRRFGVGQVDLEGLRSDRLGPDGTPLHYRAGQGYQGAGRAGGVGGGRGQYGIGGGVGDDGVGMETVPEPSPRLRATMWRFDPASPTSQLVAPRRAFEIDNCVLCSEMGFHFSPCGQMLVACVACRSPQEWDSTVYELRIYSLDAARKGKKKVLAACQVFGAACLTTIQFSPTSRHLLLAYGRKDPLLYRAMRVGTSPSMVELHTALEVYSVPDLRLVAVVPSADDEVNAAAWHPFEGCGIAYGTKEGRLRILRHSRTLTSREVDIPDDEPQPWSLFDEGGGGGDRDGSSSEDEGDDAAGEPQALPHV